MAILHDRKSEASRIAVRLRVEAHAAFHPPPAVVPATGRARRLPVDLLARVLANVSNEEVARGAVEAEAPRVPEPVGPDLSSRAGCQTEWIAGRDRVGRAAVHVDAQDLAEERVQPLRVVGGVSYFSSISDRDVEVAIGSELQLPAVVAELGVRNREKHQCGSGVRDVGVDRAWRIAGHYDVSVQAGVVDVEEALGRVALVKSQSQETPFAGARDQRANVQKGRGPDPGRVTNHDAAVLGGDEQAPRPVRSVGDGCNRAEARCRRLEGEPGGGTSGKGRSVEEKGQSAHQAREFHRGLDHDRTEGIRF